MNSKYIKSLLLVALSAGIFTTSAICIDKVSAEQTAAKTNTAAQVQTVQPTTTPLAIVNNPSAFLNKTVILNAKFDKFTTLGLDYKPALKSSKDYISFLIKRDDTSFNIPLSEMKLFLTRTKAEKFIDLKTNDEIQIKGIVFSDALGDTWIDVNELTVIKKAPEEKKN